LHPTHLSPLLEQNFNEEELKQLRRLAQLATEQEVLRTSIPQLQTALTEKARDRNASPPSNPSSSALNVSVAKALGAPTGGQRSLRLSNRPSQPAKAPAKK
jgi:hypothetical protein